MKPHCQTGSGSTSQIPARSSARSRTRRRVSPASKGSLYSRIGTARSWAGSERSPSEVDELEPAVGGAARVPPVRVTVDEYSGVGVVVGGSVLAVGDSAVDHVSITRLREIGPGGGDVARQPGGLVGSSRNPIISWSGPPERPECRGHHLEDSGHRGTRDRPGWVRVAPAASPVRRCRVKGAWRTPGHWHAVGRAG